MGVDVVVDIGAHMGYYSLLAATANDGARVVAVEASPENAEVIRRNFLAFESPRVKLIEGAFGASNDSHEFQLTEASDNSSYTGHPDSPTTHTVQVAGITGVDLGISLGESVLIKIDVEGHELAALEGLQPVFDVASQVRLLIELNPNCMRSAGYDPHSLLTWLENNDYRVFALSESERSWQELHVGTGFIDGLVGRSYVNLYCLPRRTAITMVAALHSAATNGAERTLVEFAEEFISEGGLLCTLVPQPDQGITADLVKAGSSVHGVSSQTWWAVPEASYDRRLTPAHWIGHSVSDEVNRVISNLIPDVVLTQTSVMPQAAVAAAIYGIPHVWWLHEFGDLDHQLAYPLPIDQMGSLFGQMSQLVLTNSQAVKNHFFPRGALNVEVSPPNPRAMAVSTEEKVVTPWTLGVVGGLQSGKGHDVAIKAVAHLAQTGRYVRLRFVGSALPADKERLRRLSDELGVSESLVFAGHQTEVSGVYRGLSAVLVASWAEAFGRVPFEASDAGLPVIYPLSGGIQEYMEPGVTGIAFEPRDDKSLAEAIAKLYDDKEFGKRLASAWSASVSEARADRNRTNVLMRSLHRAVKDYSETETQLFIRALATTGAYADRDAVRAELLQLVQERDVLVQERDVLVQERDVLVQERDVLVQERDVLVRTTLELEASLADFKRHLETAELAQGQAASRMQLIENSRSWRALAPYRRVGTWLKQALGRVRLP
jgi:FkbM family methyltransferase